MMERIVCPTLGPPGIVISVTGHQTTPGSGPGTGPRSGAFRILLAVGMDVDVSLGGNPVTVRDGSLLLINPRKDLVLTPSGADLGRTPGRTLGRRTVRSGDGGLLYDVPEVVFRRLANCLTTGKGGRVRFTQSVVRDRQLVAMLADIHRLLMDNPDSRRGEALFVGAAASLLRQYGQIGGIPAASPLKAAPVDALSVRSDNRAAVAIR